MLPPGKAVKAVEAIEDVEIVAGALPVKGKGGVGKRDVNRTPPNIRLVKGLLNDQFILR
jgi:hypothetical protein